MLRPLRGDLTRRGILMRGSWVGMLYASSESHSNSIGAAEKIMAKEKEREKFRLGTVVRECRKDGVPRNTGT